MEKKLTKKEERAKEAEALSIAITNRMTLVFCLLVVSIIALVRVTQSSAVELWLLTALPIFRIVTAVLLVAAFAWRIVCASRKTAEQFRLLSSSLLLGVAATLFVAAMGYNPLGAFRTIVWLLAAALLFFVYEIYAVDFFLYTVVTVVGGMAASLVDSAAFRGREVLIAAFALGATLVAVAVVSYLAGCLEKQGTAPWVGKKLIAPAGMKALNAYIGCGVALLAVLGAVCLGHVMWFIAVLAVIYLVFAIVYTVKLM